MPGESELHPTPPAFEEGMHAIVSPEAIDPHINFIHGDCLDKLPAIEPNSIHLAVTDPPYFLDGLDNKWKKGKEGARRGTGVIGGLPAGMKFDPKQGLALQEFMRNVAKKMIPVLAPGAFTVVFSQPRLVHRMAVGLEDAGFEIRDILAWRYTKYAQFKAFGQEHFVDKKDISDQERAQIKQALQGRKTPQLRPQFEAMVLAQKPRRGTFIDNWMKYKTGLIDPKVSLDDKAPSTVMTVEKPKRSEDNGHLTVKPVRLLEHLIRLFSVAGQVVLDPFLGSGTYGSRRQKSWTFLYWHRDSERLHQNREDPHQQGGLIV